MTCQRCDSMRSEQGLALIRSEILDLKACGQWAKQANDLGIRIEALDSIFAATAPPHHAAA